MKIRIEERDPERLRELAQAWGVKAAAGQSPEVLGVAIASAYRREVEAEERRAMAARSGANDNRGRGQW